MNHFMYQMQMSTTCWVSPCQNYENRIMKTEILLYCCLSTFVIIIVGEVSSSDSGLNRYNFFRGTLR